jgi:hypothetical protein
MALFKLPQAICYFNPQGEVLRDRESFEETDKLFDDNDLPALELWSNARMFQINQEWTMLDLVGNSQIDAPDLEAIYFTSDYSPTDVEQLLRVTTMIFLEDPEFKADMIEDENGVNWKLFYDLDSICDPPRQVIRMIPDDSRQPPEEEVKLS